MLVLPSRSFCKSSSSAFSKTFLPRSRVRADSEQQIKAFLEGIDAVGVHYRILLLSDLNFSPISPLNRLTEKQRDVLITAYRMGYYDVPRRGNSQDIAKKLGLVDSTVVEHLRKAEQRLIRHIIEVER